jgi:Beta-galactosidase C-terminal domain
VEIAADLVDAVTGEQAERGSLVLEPFGVRVLRVVGE